MTQSQMGDWDQSDSLDGVRHLVMDSADFLARLI